MAAQAGEVEHHNYVDVQRNSAHQLAFHFYLNVPQVLHQLLAPQLPLQEFLRLYAVLPDAELQKRVAKALSNLSSKAFLTLPSGAKVHLSHWQLPSSPDVQTSLKLLLMLQGMPPGPATHLDPVLVTAELHSKVPISQVKVQLPAELHPILVNLQNDKFWLTDQIPMAVTSLP